MAEYSGYTQGTTYHVLCDSGAGNLGKELETLFGELDHSISRWDSLSLVSRFNRSQTGLAVDENFASAFNLSKRIHAETGGAFNPAIYPLVQLWGLDQNRPQTDSLFLRNPRPDSVLRFTRFDDISISGPVTDSSGKKAWFVSKKYPQNALDFNGLSGGFVVDAVCALLDKRGIANYKVEIGQEVRAKGLGTDGKPWTVPIDKPTGDGEPRSIGAILPLEDRAMSTSGSYRNYYEKDGKRLSYRIDPVSGRPVEHTLLSSTVFAGTAAEADAYATAFMVMGAGETTHFLSGKPALWAYLVSSGFDKDYQTWMSPGLETKLKERK